MVPVMLSGNKAVFNEKKTFKWSSRGREHTGAARKAVKKPVVKAAASSEWW
jgi:hypothetical protein